MTGAIITIWAVTASAGGTEYRIRAQWNALQTSLIWRLPTEYSRSEFSFVSTAGGHHNRAMYETLLHKPKNSGRFASLMELYEQNYVLIRLLAPALKNMGDGEFVSTAPGAMPLVLDHVEHNRYTTTFKLTYQFSSVQRHAREPDLAIRLYHDARSCEVMSGLLPGSRHEIRRTRDLEDGRRLNRFLNKWLRYCLRQGHSFTVVPREAPSHPSKARKRLVKVR